MKHITSTIGLLMLSLIFMLAGCGEVTSEQTQNLTRTIYALDTVITINLYDGGDEALMDELEGRIEYIESIMSAQKEDSEVAAINDNAGIGPVIVSDETYKVVERALYYAELSSGRFDPTVGPIIKLWGIGTEDARVPEQSEIDEALKLVDYSKVVIDSSAHSVYLEETGMSIDLGGIAKGYVADELVAILERKGLDKAMINLGGNIYAYGEKGEDTPWKIGVQTPYDTRNVYFGYLSVADKTVVTSGPYERYFEADGKIYHHIFNANTGYPIDSDVASVTIIADTSMDADAMSTLMFTFEPDEGLAFIENLPDVDCIYVDKELNLTLSSGTKSMFTLTDDTYTIVE